jgi:WD40 repeat protein
MVTSGNDLKVIVWDVSEMENPKQLQTFADHKKFIRCVRFSPDGAHLASSSMEGKVVINRVDETGDPTILEGHLGDVRSFSYNHDGSRLVSAGYDNRLCLWDTKTGELIRKVEAAHRANVTFVTFSPDGQWIASSDYKGLITIWDSELRDRMQQLYGHWSEIWQLCFTPDGQHLVSCGNDNTVKVWDLSGLATSNKDAFTRSIACSKSGNLTARGFDTGEVQIVAKEGQKVSHKEFRSAVTAVSFSLDEHLLASGASDGSMVLRDLAGETTKHISAHDSKVTDLTFSEDGKQILSGCEEGLLKLWDVESGKLLKENSAEHQVFSIACTPDGNYFLASANLGDQHRVDLKGYYNVYDSVDLSPVKTITGHNREIRDICFSPKKDLFATAGGDGTAIAWNYPQFTQRSTFRFESRMIQSVAFDDSGTRLFVGLNDGRIQLVDIESGEKLLDLDELGQAGEVDVEFSDGVLIAASASGESINRNVEPSTRYSILDGHEDHVSSVCFSPDGKTFASGSLDRTVRIWDLETRSTIETLEGDRGRVKEVWYSKDGRKLYSQNEKGVVICRDLDTSTDSAVEMQFSLEGHENNRRNGNFFLSTSIDHILLFEDSL